MKRTLPLSPHPVRLTGAAIVAADAALTIHSAGSGFCAFFGRGASDLRETSLSSLLPSVPSHDLRAAVLSGDPFWEGLFSVSRDGVPAEAHLSATRIEARCGEQGTGMYHVVLTDLTGLGEMRRNAALEKKKYAIIADLSEDIPFEYDFVSDVMIYAEKYRTVFGREPVIRRFQSMYAKGALPGGLLEAFRVLLAEKGKPPQAPLEYRALTAEGALRWFSCFWNRLTDERGGTTKVVGAIRDIDRQKREQLRLLDKSRTDAMTGLLNKATTEEEIRAALTAVSPGSMGVLLMLDLDNFKNVNDSMGHQAGDEVLVRLARQLSRTFRGDDIIGRVGGDEFHIFMRKVRNIASVYERAQEICSAARKLFSSSLPDSSVSVSIGIACAKEPLPYADLFRKADVALYQAKANGKNRYEVFGQADEARELRGGPSSSLATRVARNSIVAEIIDTLFGAEDMRQGIDNALDFIGNTLRVDAILIYEKSLDFKMIGVTHEWTAKSGRKSGAPGPEVPVEMLRLPRPATPGGIFYCSDLSGLPPEEKNFDINPAVTSLLQCDILRDGLVAGAISFEERGHKRIWTRQEIDALILLSKLLGGHIRQKQASSLLRRSKEATRDILNSLPGTYVFVIAKASLRLLYFNSKVSEQFPRARIGMTCHELFRNCSLPCAGCHRGKVSGSGTYTRLLRDVPFGKSVRLSTSELLWENREAAYVTLISEHLPTPGEREQQRRKEAYIHALCASYDYVLDIDPRSGRYEMLALADVSRQSFPAAGDYNPVLRRISDARIRREDRELFWDRFRMEALNGAFARGAASVELEYGWRDDAGRLFWKNRLALPHRPADGSFRILTYVRDITVQKERDLRQRQEEAGYLLALQSNYSEIFRIDLRTRRISPLYYNSEQVVISADAADLSEFVRLRAANRLAPECRAEVMAFYNPEKIREKTARSEVMECEYRKRQILGGEYRRIAATILSVPGQTDSALLLLRDVTRSREKEANYLLALQSNYSEIFHINLELRRISPLYYNSEQVIIPADAADLSEFVRERAKNRIHPESRAAVMSFYTADHIREVREKGETRELEYRKKQVEGGGYRWIVATLRPVPGDPCGVLLLLRDITRNREEEANFYAALRNGYSEVYEVDLDADTVRPVTQSAELPFGPLSGGYLQDTLTLAEMGVHPEDRAAFLDMSMPDNLRRRLREGKDLSLEYRRKGSDGSYRTVASLVLPMPGSACKMLVLGRDVTGQKRMEEANRRLERRYNAVFRQSYDIVTEINLRTAEYTRTFFSHRRPLPALRGNYARDLPAIFAQVHPEDRESLLRARGLEALREAFASGEPLHGCQIRMCMDNAWVWMESQVFFLTEGGEPTAFVLARNISYQKKLEEERSRDAQRLSIALRDTYAEIYELDIETHVSTLLFSNSVLLRPVGTGNPVNTADAIREALHPDDHQPVAACFDSARLRACFERGQPEVTAEFRRLGLDGAYYWVAATIVPLRDALGFCGKTMLLVKDISARKEQEQRERIMAQYNLALRNIYDELYECNVTRDVCRLVHHVGDKYVPPPENGTPSRLVEFLAHKLIHPEDRKAFLNLFGLQAVRNEFAGNREFLIGEFRRLGTDGGYHWVSFTMFPVGAGLEAEELYLVCVMDIDARKRGETIAQQNILLERQREADERYRLIVERTHTLIFEWGENGARYLSAELPQRFSGAYDERDLLRVWKEDGVVHPDDLSVFECFLQDTRLGKHAEMTVRLRLRSGEFVWCKVVVSCLSEKDGRRVIGTLNDVHEATRAAMDLRYRAEYDVLTGIYNMQTFYSRAEQLLRKHPEQRYFVIRMDIDRFKVINDLYGMQEGDKLLRVIAGMLRKRTGAHGVCGRISGDVFCACVDFSRAQVLDFVTGIREELGNYPLPSRIVPSFGICGVDNVETPMNMLCDWANLALRTVKGNVLTPYAFYDQTLRVRILEEKKIESEMHEALALGQFELYLQPKVHIPTSRIIGSEGLVRWRHPREGLIHPERFIPLFERNGFIIRLDEYVWEQACLLLRGWLDQGLEPLPVSVNVSRMHIHDTRLCDKLPALLAKYNLPPRLLELELTESVFLDSENQLFEAIRHLRRHGFIFSLDDFGAGYSSLNVLKSLPVETIKIDRGFLNEIVATSRGKIIIRHIISLARELNIQVIAEGVENAAQAAFLVDAGCFLSQGFYYSPPVRRDTFERLAFAAAPPFPLLPLRTAGR